MQSFRKKPVVIEAQQYVDAESGSEIISRIIDEGGTASLHCVDLGQPDHGGHTIMIRTLEGDMHASSGDWVIRGVQGEFYPCKPEIFEATYDVADASQEQGKYTTHACPTCGHVHLPPNDDAQQGEGPARD